jgi:RimJ/RimL family protein N-acetyltransferase/pimeloyl-ACP methyl ester carboxylesterase
VASELTLRPLAASDASELRRIRATPAVRRWWDALEDDFPWSDEPDATRFAIVVDGAVAGMIQFSEESEPRYRHAAIDLFLDPALHGRGIGSEAVRRVVRHLVEERGHHRVTIDPAVENVAAVRAYEKAGFRPVGVMRRSERDADGDGWHDSLLMELLASEQKTDAPSPPCHDHARARSFPDAIAAPTSTTTRRHRMLTEHETSQIERANATGLTPVVFIHGLWLLPSSWDRWATVFEEAGYTALTPAWPDDPETVAEANAHPEVFADKTVGQVADHFEEVIGQLTQKPAVIGHSFGGLLTQIVAGRGVAAASVAIDPAPFRGVLPLPISALRSSRPVLGNPANRSRAVPLTYEQFRFAFANAVSEDEASELYSTFAVPASGIPLFQAATANLNPWTEAKVNSTNPDRGPLLIISGERDNTVPWAIANASFKKQKRNESVTEIAEIPNRGHALTIDSGWREVADTALAFVKRFV